MNGKKGIIVAFGIGITLLVWIIIITALRRIDENPDVKTTEKPTEPTKPEPEPKNMSEPSNITNIISNNQSGGITAHTVNMGPEKRSLSLQQREALLITLKTKPKGKVSVCWVESDLEATAFAQEISKLLRDAGNDVTTLPHAWITGSDGVGLSFKIRDDESLVKYADPILGSFKAAGIEARGEKSSEFRGDMLQITVGAKPLD